MTDETGLPRNVALLWGVAGAPRRGPKPTLSVEDITRAAIEVADAEGLAAVSMSRVAAQLGNATMALYRHVKSKDELLVLMSDAAVERPPDLPTGDWRLGLTLWARGVLAAVGRHPWYAKLPISGPPLGPGNLAWFDRALGALSDTGLGDSDTVAVVMGLLTYVHGQIRLGGDLAAGYAEDPDAFGPRYGAALARVVDPLRFPALSKLLAAGLFDEETQFEEEFEADFEFGLTLYLDGVAGFIARRGSTPPP